jgi:hypothetical protein
MGLLVLLMKKSVLALALVSALVVAPLFEVTRANPLPPVWLHPEMTVTIHSPQNGAYNALTVSVYFSAQLINAFNYLTDTPNWVSAFFYVLDCQDMSSSGIKIEQIKLTGVNYASYYAFNYSGQAYLSDLTAGSHSITVYYGVLDKGSKIIAYNASWSATSQFYVITPVTLLIGEAISIVAVVAVVLFFYFKKRK